MPLLFRKLIRDFRQQRGQFFALFLVIFIGACLFNAAFLSYANLRQSGEATINKLNLADLTLYLTQAPSELIEEAEKIEGVLLAEGRYSGDAELGLPGEEEKYKGRIHPPADGSINKIYLNQGRLPESSEEILILESFATAHHLRPGSKVFLLAEGRRVDLVIAGTAYSPEYLYPLSGSGSLFTEPGDFPVVFASGRVIEELFQPGDNVNEIALLLKEGASREQIREKLESLGEPFGLKKVIYREDQPGYLAFRMELLGLAEWGVMFPLLFFLVAAMIIAVLSTRMVERERSQIGILRSLGFTKGQVAFLYLGYSGLLGLAGGLFGTLGGYYLSYQMTILYSSYFALPYLVLKGNFLCFLIGLFLPLIICLLSGLTAARKAVSIEPAQAMRPPIPEAGHKIPGEDLILSHFTVWNRLALRNIFRKAHRSLFLLLGVVSSCVVIVLAFSFYDTIDGLLKKQFEEVAAYDAKVNFSGLQSDKALFEVSQWEGVTTAEPLLEIPATLTKGEKEFESQVMGLLPEGRLYRLPSSQGSNRISGDAVVISKQVAKSLDASPGDTITIAPALAGCESRTYPVRGVADIPFGSQVFLSLNETQDLSGGGEILSGALLSFGHDAAGKIQETGRDLCGVASLEFRGDSLSIFKDMMGMFYAFIGIMVIFGIVLACSVIFSVAGVNILERLRELAVLRVLGASKREVGRLVLKENLFLSLVGIFLGLPLGKATAFFFMNSYSSDLMTLDTLVYPRTYFLSTGIVLASIIFVQLLSLKQVFQYPLTEACRRTDE